MSEELKLTLDTFTPWVETQFKVQSKLAQVELELAAATGMKNHGASGEAFSLLFTGPETRWLPQGTYGFEHDRIGNFQLFIVPVGKEGGRMQYEAVFNNASRV